MRIHLLSDLHLEHGPLSPPATDADVVILAGDIHQDAAGVKWAAATFDAPVLYVAGNHEYYGGAMPRVMEKMHRAAEGTNVTVMENRVVVLGGVRFIGATLWTDFNLHGNQPMARLAALAGMNDYRYIRDGRYRRIRPEDSLAIHARSRAFVTAALSEPFDGPTVVVSHHAPSAQSSPPEYRDSRLAPGYASDLAAMVKEGNPVLWVHGHTHSSADYDMDGTRVVCNPRGYYPGDTNPTFDAGLILTV